MKTKLLHTLLALCTASLTVTAQVSPMPATKPSVPTDGQPPRGDRPPPPWLKALDANGDGVISADEITNAPTALRTLDLNKDGVLTPDELHPKPPVGEPRGPKREPGPEGGPGGPRESGRRPERGDKKRPAPPIIKALDTNNDHKISSDEIDKAATSLKTLDKNKDGQLTEDEIRPPRPPRPPEDGDGGPDGQEPPPPPPAE